MDFNTATLKQKLPLNKNIFSKAKIKPKQYLLMVCLFFKKVNGGILVHSVSFYTWKATSMAIGSAFNKEARSAHGPILTSLSLFPKRGRGSRWHHGCRFA